ncbi:hypothetical protein F511_13816 [Dorcoceras hygrometricum]|uniref:Uncharacterized protein n=1 Tax=Dorcoceras hygrometricum TaxID=472368 RepID=A0A2Z7DFQ9_9LAMI|nr:hypothetical protein F511_13816 [Dorcoceras hygrometricum]
MRVRGRPYLVEHAEEQRDGSQQKQKEPLLEIRRLGEMRPIVVSRFVISGQYVYVCHLVLWYDWFLRGAIELYSDLVCLMRLT